MNLSEAEIEKIRAQRRKLKWLSNHGLNDLFLWFHKYLVAIVLCITTAMSSIMTTEWYESNYYWSIETYGFGLILLSWLHLDGWWHNKCLWFHSCVAGLAFDCLVNIYYGPNYEGAYFMAFKIVPSAVALGIAFILIRVEKRRLTRKN